MDFLRGKVVKPNVRLAGAAPGRVPGHGNLLDEPTRLALREGQPEEGQHARPDALPVRPTLLVQYAPARAYCFPDSPAQGWAGAAKAPRGVKRRARLGIIAGFYPADMVPDVAKAKRRAIVGGHHATGQQVHEPGKHMPWPQAFRWMKAEDWPPVYKNIKTVRQEVRAGKRPRIYEDVAGDTDAERETKRQFRSLLG